MDATFDERARTLQERLNAPEPETWRPDDPQSGHGRLLIGELLAVQEGHTAYGPKQIAVLRDAEGKLWNVWLLNQVLANEFARQQPTLGEMLALAYDGRIQRANGPDYEKYRLVIDRKGQQVAWHGAHDDPTPAPANEPAPAPPVQPQLDADLCAECGYANGRHAQNCSENIPF